jgi:hypothetical protein
MTEYSIGLFNTLNSSSGYNTLIHHTICKEPNPTVRNLFTVHSAVVQGSRMVAWTSGYHSQGSEIERLKLQFVPNV